MEDEIMLYMTALSSKTDSTKTHITVKDQRECETITLKTHTKKIIFF